MRIVYQSTNVADLYVLRDLLAEADIPAHVQGEFLRGGIGELPADTPVSLAVAAAQADAARAIVLDWERSRPEDEESDTMDTSASAATPARRGASALQVLGTLALGAFCGGAIVWAIYNHPVEGSGRDFDGDGRADERVILAGDRFDRVETDRNRDGKADEIARYSADGEVDRVELDEDFDGRFEAWLRYDENLPVEGGVDRDGDGTLEARTVYVNGVVVKQESFDTHAHVVRTIEFRGGAPVPGEFDSDGDGVLDTARTYDARGEIVASKPLTAVK